MKKTMMILLGLVFSSAAFAGFHGYQGTTDLGLFMAVKCSTGTTCTKVGTKLNITATPSSLTGPVSIAGTVSGDGTGHLQGFMQNRVTATAVSITAAQCGSTFINSGAVQMGLPEASTVLGCRLTFVTANASNFDVNPDDADQILVQTDAAGDKTRNATLGNSITIEAISSSQWAPISIIGTWSDAN